MKKILMFALAAVTLSTAKVNAQTEKGNIMIGGTLGGINYDKSGNNKVFSIGVTPNVAWFIQNNLAVGGGLDISYRKPKDVKGTFNLGIVPLARYYFSREGRNGIFGEAKFGFGVTSVDGDGSTSLVYGLGLGYNRFFTRNVALELGLGWNQYDALKSGVDGSTNIGLNVGLQIFLPRREARSMMNR